MTVEQIARVCHEANRAYCKTLGDDSQPPWSEAPEWQQISAISGVQFLLDNPNAEPRDSHEQWLRAKTADGWKYALPTYPVDLPPARGHGALLSFPL